MDLGFLRLIFYKGFSYKKEHGACISKFSGTLLQSLLGQAYSTALPNPYSSADPIAALMLATLPTETSCGMSGNKSMVNKPLEIMKDALNFI